MSDDEADPELLALLRQSLGIKTHDPELPPETGVLEGAEHVYNQAIDVALDTQATKAAAQAIYEMMQRKSYSTKTWAEHELHPKEKDESTVNFIFTMDLLNFSFWSERTPEERFAIEYKGRKWTGYWSLVAALQRALDEGIPITSPTFWRNEGECSIKVLRHVFRSATEEDIPLFDERVACLREAGQVLCEHFDSRFSTCITQAQQSAAGLVNLLATNFSCFRDAFRFEGKRVHIYKRAQILVADLWACFNGTSYGTFNDIDKITMFADYRIPQMLQSFDCLRYSPPLEMHIRHLKPLESGHPWEIQLRCCSIWSVELLRREIIRTHPGTHVNAILIDFFLYDTMKEREAAGLEGLPHHRTRSIWY
ncbi:hypothetical protein L228DRAFT_43135 [Xylona heveae TC161]|uniref:Queuosine 5'-phosphate N-glycosylase/hydrolase n=1 Tax=Xylona heveae (strain CBS 132557 / TC161) TaxID=1328760 RepID=A0A164ZRE5_XYLHT|nr:hypothetical protein L228DRAFT_43135 [Xylona heveae TC161]KZF19416.1 hypothetical protein L228DRAFT_43135 [Xylona heveae TC161]